MNTIYSIQYLRALAAILVVYCHAIDNVGSSLQTNFLFLNNFGALGVDIFFVLSGFIISIIGEGEFGKNAFYKFLKKRFIRINLIYYIITCILICYLLLCNRAIDFNSLVKSITILPIFDFGEKLINPILFIGWTLSFEWFFYLIYSTLIGFSVLKRDFFLISFLPFLCIMGFLFTFNDAHWTFITSPMLLEFTLGILVAKVYKTTFIKLPKFIVYLIFFTSLVMFLFLIIYGYGSISEADLILKGIGTWNRFFLWGIPSALLVAGLVLIEKDNSEMFIKSKLLLGLGNASYSIYLTHVLFFLVYKFFNTRIIFIQYINADLKILILTFLSVIIGYIFYKYFEVYLLKYANKIMS